MMQKIEKALAIVLGTLLALMVLDVTWQILTRFLPMQPSSYTEEVARYLLVWIGVLGGAYAYRKRSHLGIDLLSNALHGAKRRALQIFVVLVCFAFAASAMVYGGTKLMLLTFELEQYSAALNLPIGFVYSVLPLSGLLICLFSVDHLIELVTTKEELPTEFDSDVHPYTDGLEEESTSVQKEKQKQPEAAVEA
ncbi:TRAP transporter small permease [Microbulbifer hydrolyticus]|uniref:TRAP transporter small permease protein n=1 Tax=Microbulbifer hydrolyticus TaxID=48074 RepID=A0A6P1THT0_9GAMM|nr:TRAP transporter small permease [Microbulbifer hydrolyticus]MBB5213018.1 TRAP-type C4-dicarboxylate transport system permease small subunit [Microbulbifer hydrolyticus]QHQ40382.1 TRAP transporter small permease subunit [Microbulbifer hydrolyticus]